MNSSNDNPMGFEYQLFEVGQAIQEKIVKNPREVYRLITQAVCQSTEADCAVLYPYHPSYGEFYDVSNVAYYGLREALPMENV